MDPASRLRPIMSPRLIGGAHDRDTRQGENKERGHGPFSETAEKREGLLPNSGKVVAQKALLLKSELPSTPLRYSTASKSQPGMVGFWVLNGIGVVVKKRPRTTA